MYCMVKGDHVYTLNYDLQSLDQKLNVKPEFCIKASPEYHIQEEKDDPVIASHNLRFIRDHL